jgi:16S rRNA (cytosine1402-N4)-methyltransferase
MTQKDHMPVMLDEVMTYLEVTRNGTYIDCTIGLGGHAQEILKRNPKANLIGFDLDEKSLFKAKESLIAYAERVELIHSDFRYLPDLNIDFPSIRGVLIDLGISSYQLDSPERGFSYSQDGPLDMRFDLRNKTTAEKVIHRYSEHKLDQVFKDYGELRQARRLAKSIVSQRKIKKIERTQQLLEIVETICRWIPQKGKSHPAAKVFQALRIEVNQELKDLDHFLERMIHKIPRRTRIAVISFHSLEDRIIKRTFKQLARPDEGRPVLKILTKKPVTPTETEIKKNFRSRSAKLRAVEKL